MMRHLNSFSASGGGNLNKNFLKIQMPEGLLGGGRGGAMLKLRFEWYIIYILFPQMKLKRLKESRSYARSLVRVSYGTIAAIANVLELTVWQLAIQ